MRVEHGMVRWEESLGSHITALRWELYRVEFFKDIGSGPSWDLKILTRLVVNRTQRSGHG